MHIGMFSEMGAEVGVDEFTRCHVASGVLYFFHAVIPLASVKG